MINLGQSVFQDTLIPQGVLTENGIYGRNIWEIRHPTSPLFGDVQSLLEDKGL